MSAAVVTHGGADGLGHVVDVSQQRLQGLARQISVSLKGVVQVVDIALVVLAVVDLHGTLIDMGLEGVVGVG